MWPKPASLANLTTELGVSVLAWPSEPGHDTILDMQDDRGTHTHWGQTPGL